MAAEPRQAEQGVIVTCMWLFYRFCFLLVFSFLPAL